MYAPMIYFNLLSVACYHSATMTAFPGDRRDLAAMFVPLARALVAREEPAPLTPAGDRLRRSVEAAIRASEQEVLATLSAGDREAFLRSLMCLYGRYRAPTS